MFRFSGIPKILSRVSSQKHILTSGGVPPRTLVYDPYKDVGEKKYFRSADQGLTPQHFDDPELERRLDMLMQRFRVDHLVGISKRAFEAHIEEQLGKMDYEIEGYKEKDLARQRDLSVKFHWGHDHDFGSFSVTGRCGRRHITVMKDFINAFAVDEKSFRDRDVLDVGCWTGGTTLLLGALGAHVTSLEEVRKYADMAAFLSESFGLSAHIKNRSLYDIEWENRFDIVFYPGVLYHVSDPVLSLRILYNALRMDGTILVESSGINVRSSACYYEGCMEYHSGTADELGRGGWNWFSPSPLALARMMWMAGFDGIQIAWIDERVYGYGKKLAENPITLAGLSRRDIP